MKTHKRLKGWAVQWLCEKGFTTSNEVWFGKDRVDVIGQKELITVGIECGNTPYNKLLRLSKLLNTLYVWLYHDQSPIPFTGQVIKYRNTPHQTKSLLVGKPDPEEIHKQYALYFPRA